MKRIKDLYKKIKSKKGFLAIEIVIGMFMFLLILSFLTDVSLLTWKFNAISHANSSLARTVGIQGGLLSSTPVNFPGGDENYVTISEMDSRIKEIMDKAGVEEYSYTVTPNKADYGEYITTTITAKYKWSLLSNFIPGDVEHELVSKRTVMSEFKYRYDSFKGE